MKSPSKSLRYAIGAGIVFAVIGVLFSVQVFRSASPNKTSAPAVVRLGSFSTAIDYAPYLVARSKGWFEEALKPHGVQVEYTTFQTLPSINEAFASGKVDFVCEAEPPAIIGRAAGIDIRIIGLSCSLQQEIIVPTASPAQSIADLKGKRVAVLAGTSSHYALLSIASGAGLSEDALQVLDMVPPDARAAFETGQVDAWAVWPPWVEQELVAKKGRVLPGGEAKIQSVLAARGGFLHGQPKMAEAVVTVFDKAKKWVSDNPKEAISIVASELKLSPEVVALAWPKHDWQARFTAPVVADIQAKADFLVGKGLIKSKVDVEKDLIQPLGDSK